MKINKSMLISISLTSITLIQYIRLIISARYYGNIEYAGQTVRPENNPLGIVNVSALVTDSNSYTSVTWMLALFTLIFLAVSATYMFKTISPYVFMKMHKKEIEKGEYVEESNKFLIYNFLTTYGLYFMIVLLFVQTFRVGFYSAVGLEVVSGHILYTIAYIPYWIVSHPWSAIAVLFVLFGIVTATPRFASLAEAQNHYHKQNQRINSRLQTDALQNMANKKQSL